MVGSDQSGSTGSKVEGFASNGKDRRQGVELVVKLRNTCPSTAEFCAAPKMISRSLVTGECIVITITGLELDA